MQAEASLWPGQGIWGGPRKGPRTLPTQSHRLQFPPRALAVPQGSAILTLKKTRPLPLSSNAGWL